MKNEFRSRFFASFIAAGMLFGMSAFAALAQELVVQGNSRVDATTIKSYFSGQSAAELEKELSATGLFSSVRVSKVGSKLVVKVTENNIINRVAFEGNKKLVSEVLEGELQLKSRGAFSEARRPVHGERLGYFGGSERGKGHAVASDGHGLAVFNPPGDIGKMVSAVAHGRRFHGDTTLSHDGREDKSALPPSPRGHCHLPTPRVRRSFPRRPGRKKRDGPEWQSVMDDHR